MSQKRKLKVAEDLDGVWYDFSAGYTTLYNRLHGTTHSADWQTWAEFHDWGQSTDEFKDLLTRAPWMIFGDFQLAMVTDADARRFVMEFDVTFVTSRPETAQDASAAFLTYLIGARLPYDLVLTHDKGLAGFDIAVDDLPKNLFAYEAAGCPNLILRRHPWNEGQELPEGTIVCDTWEQVYQACKEIEAGVRS